MKRRNCKQVLNQKGRSPFGLRPFAAFRALNKSDEKCSELCRCGYTSISKRAFYNTIFCCYTHGKDKNHSVIFDSK